MTSDSDYTSISPDAVMIRLLVIPFFTFLAYEAETEP
jgi:hypothetical protein